VLIPISFIRHSLRWLIVAWCKAWSMMSQCNYWVFPLICWFEAWWLLCLLSLIILRIIRSIQPNRRSIGTWSINSIRVVRLKSLVLVMSWLCCVSSIISIVLNNRSWFKSIILLITFKTWLKHLLYWLCVIILRCWWNVY
jgi:hypothetical protein